MTKFNIIGILMLSVIAIAPVVDAGCACSGGNWDPSGFLNSEVGTGQPCSQAAPGIALREIQGAARKSR